MCDCTRKSVSETGLLQTHPHLPTGMKLSTCLTSAAVIVQLPDVSDMQDLLFYSSLCPFSPSPRSYFPLQETEGNCKEGVCVNGTCVRHTLQKPSARGPQHQVTHINFDMGLSHSGVIPPFSLSVVTRRLNGLCS